MKINCREQWLEGLRYFLDPSTIAKLRAVGLHVEKMDWRNQQVILGADSEDQLQAAIEGVAQIEEKQSVWFTNIALMLAGDCGSKSRAIAPLNP